MNRLHGFSHTPIYIVWVSMRQRCSNPNDPDYHLYGGRGIKVSEQWSTFPQFMKDMGQRPKGAMLDRVNNDGDYCPENCRWASPTEQARNRRSTLRFSHEGRTMTLKEWADEHGIAYGTLYDRIFSQRLPLFEAVRWTDRRKECR